MSRWESCNPICVLAAVVAVAGLVLFVLSILVRLAAHVFA